MLQINEKVFFTALGFLAVILADEPKDKQAQRARDIARLIKSFCMSVNAEVFEKHDGQETIKTRDRMVAAISEIMKSNGKCEPQHLRSLNYTPEEIELHWPMAHALACVALNIKPLDS